MTSPQENFSTEVISEPDINKLTESSGVVEIDGNQSNAWWIFNLVKASPTEVQKEVQKLIEQHLESQG